ncbi:MAG TPA: high-affinity nickel-transport family protein [Polyangiaceae bacterium]
MNGPLTLMALGFALGMRHATDSDHVVAVTTIVSREQRIGRAAWIGALWGIGHTATLVAVGLPIVLFGLVVPFRLSLSLEFSVALMLMVLGVLNLAEYFRRLHVPHSHAEPSSTRSRFGLPLGGRGALRPLAIGVVHGLAGSAAVALLVLSEVRDAAWAALYLLLFGVGTIAGMACVTALVAAPFAFAGARARGLAPHFAWISGLLSLGFGAFLVYEIGFVDGLFLNRP